MKKEIPVFVHAALLLALLAPSLVYSGVAGLPSKPKFQEVTVNTSNGNRALMIRPEPAGTAAINLESHPNAAFSVNNRLAIIRFKNVDISDNEAYSRWGIRKTSALESGGDVGSDFEFESFGDTGAHLGYPLTITRRTGAVTIGEPFGQAGSLYVVDGPDPRGDIDNGSIHLVGRLNSTKVCASGYTRITPNYCAITGSPPTVASLTAAGCTQTTALTGVTDAKAVRLKISNLVASDNAVALRGLNATLYRPTDTTCVTAIFSAQSNFYEFNATADTEIGRENMATVVESGTTGRLYVNGVFALAGTGSTISFSALGYFD